MLNDIQMEKFKAIEEEVREAIRTTVEITNSIVECMDEVLYNGEATEDQLDEIALFVQNLALEEASRMYCDELEVDVEELEKELKEGVKEFMKNNY